MKMKLGILSFLLTCVAVAADRGEEIRLWPNGAPGSEGITDTEVSKPSANSKYSSLPGNFTVTHYPSLFVFLPPKEKATGAAMIVAPGGGHNQLVIEKEGWEFADWLNDRGIAAFVLKYRLARASGSKYTLPNEVYADAARSVRTVRSRAKEWGLDPNRIGFIGFSAGGEVAGMIGTKFDSGDSTASDAIDRVSSRPDFDVLVYPFYRPGSAPSRPGSLSGTAPNSAASPLGTAGNAASGPATLPALTPIGANLQFPIPDDAPPAFLVCTSDDPSHVLPTVKYYLELQAHKIPAEMHIYEYGGHGFALRPTKKPGSPVESWPARLVDWLNARGISKPLT